jgi:hypothetical protein
MRNRLSKIGSEPVNVILPPVSVGDRPMLFINCSNAALMSNSCVLCLLTTILPSDLSKRPLDVTLRARLRENYIIIA